MTVGDEDDAALCSVHHSCGRAACLCPVRRYGSAITPHLAPLLSQDVAMAEAGAGNHPWDQHCRKQSTSRLGMKNLFSGPGFWIRPKLNSWLETHCSPFRAPGYRLQHCFCRRWSLLLCCCSQAGQWGLGWRRWQGHLTPLPGVLQIPGEPMALPVPMQGHPPACTTFECHSGTPAKSVPRRIGGRDFS